MIDEDNRLLRCYAIARLAGWITIAVGTLTLAVLI